ncbi:hypothetical protein BAUCODRAFT_40589, partial [Baudoinia panamericana UAMH 10762]
KSKLLIPPRPDWYAAEWSTLDNSEVSTVIPPQRILEELHRYATSLLETENATYNASHLAGSSSHKFLSTIMSSGTLEDKVSALTLLVQESPLHTMKALENLLGLSRKKSRNQALMALAALKDLLGQGVVLPADRKLRAFTRQPALLKALQGKPATKWATGEPLPGGLQKQHLMLWAYEDWLKRTYFDLLHVLEGWCNDEVEYARSRAITYVFELLRDKPEQEENLLRLLVNKLRDTDRKIASRASYLLLQLENTHPAMKLVVTNSIEADCLFRPGQSLHAKYYAIITLNQTILSQKEESIANRLLDIYFSMFVQLLKPTDKALAPRKPGVQQGGGGKAGKLAAKKQKAQERTEEAELQLRDKMMAQVLTGVNRAFPFADASDPTFEKQMDTIFRVAHSSNFNTAIQALMLIQQISATKHYGAERFYRTLYESLLDPRLNTSSKQVMYLNLLYKSLKADLDAKRVQAFVKRLLQTTAMHEPPFVCGVLYLISELAKAFPNIRNMITEPEVEMEDEEERYVDAPEGDGTSVTPTDAQSTGSTPNGNNHSYDPRKRDPSHAHADQSALWDLLPLISHFHPSVSLLATSLLMNQAISGTKPDPTHHTLMHFLDRFAYRNAKTKPAVSHGSSIMQPMGGSSHAADLLVKPGNGDRGAAAGGGGGGVLEVNSEAFWRKKVEDVAADEVFFHEYFTRAGKGRREEKKKLRKGVAQGGMEVVEDLDAAEGEDEANEDEIWQAIAQSRPEVEGDDEDDELSFGDLEDASDAGSEAGIDLGGGGDDGDEGDMEAAFAEMDGLLGGDDDDALLGSDEEAAVDMDSDMDEAAPEARPESKGKQKRKEKKKLKALPTFASVEDYAKLLAEE